MYLSMKILVTGSSGTVGTRLCEMLIEKGYEVIGADWKPNKWKPSVNNITVNADLRDSENLGALPADVDAIMHLAANARVYELVKEPDMARDNEEIFSLCDFIEHAIANLPEKIKSEASFLLHRAKPTEMTRTKFIRKKWCV